MVEGRRLTMNRPVPPTKVLRSFGVESALPPAGGQGTSWRAGDLVLKPASGPVHEWLTNQLSSLPSEGVRISAPGRHTRRQLGV